MRVLGYSMDYVREKQRPCVTVQTGFLWFTKRSTYVCMNVGFRAEWINYNTGDRVETGSKLYEFLNKAGVKGQLEGVW